MMEEKVKEILEDIKPDIDLTHAVGFITDKVIDSIDMMELITRLEDTFGIEISMEYMDSAHFDTIDSIVAMIEELS